MSLEVAQELHEVRKFDYDNFSRLKMQIKTHIKEALDKTEVIIIAAGAGMGVDSGLPDFRGKDGF